MASNGEATTSATDERPTTTTITTTDSLLRKKIRISDLALNLCGDLLSILYYKKFNLDMNIDIELPAFSDKSADYRTIKKGVSEEITMMLCDYLSFILNVSKKNYLNKYHDKIFNIVDDSLSEFEKSEIMKDANIFNGNYDEDFRIKTGRKKEKENDNLTYEQMEKLIIQKETLYNKTKLQKSLLTQFLALLFVKLLENYKHYMELLF